MPKAAKLTPAQTRVLTLMSEGWKLKHAIGSRATYLQLGDIRHSVYSNTLDSLLKRGLVRSIDRLGTSGWVWTYEQTYERAV